MTHSDVIVIGGGAIGLCASYYLRREGAHVILLEKREIGHACSFRNAGLVVPSHFIPLAAPGVLTQGMQWLLDPESPFYIKPRLNAGLVKWIWKFYRSATSDHVQRSMRLLQDLCQSGSSLFDELQSLDGTDFGLTKKGLLMLFRTERGRSSCMHEADLAGTLGVEVRRLDHTNLQNLEPRVPFSAAGAIYYPGDSHLSPSAFVGQMQELVTRSGVIVRQSVEVLQLLKRHRLLTGVRTSDGVYTADNFVLAGGSWSPLLLHNIGITMPLQPGKGYSITVAAPPWQPTIPMILTEHRVAITPLSGLLRFAGTMELAGLDLSINQRRVNAILNAVPLYINTARIPTPEAADLWGGLRPCSPDGLPYIGRFREARNLIAATGHAMLGITLAPVTGKLVAEILAENTPSISLPPLSPDRFN